MSKKEKDLSDKVKDTYELIIQCSSEQEVKNLYKKLTEEGYRCRVLIL